MTKSTTTTALPTFISREETDEQERRRQARGSARSERMGEISADEAAQKNREHEARRYERQADLDARRVEFYKKIAAANRNPTPKPRREPAPGTTRR